MPKNKNTTNVSVKRDVFFLSVEGFNPEDEAMNIDNHKDLKYYRNIHARNPHHVKYFPLENKYIFQIYLIFAFKTS